VDWIIPQSKKTVQRKVWHCSAWISIGFQIYLRTLCSVSSVSSTLFAPITFKNLPIKIDTTKLALFPILFHACTCHDCDWTPKTKGNRVPDREIAKYLKCEVQFHFHFTALNNLCWIQFLSYLPQLLSGPIN